MVGRGGVGVQKNREKKDRNLPVRGFAAVRVVVNNIQQNTAVPGVDSIVLIRQDILPKLLCHVTMHVLVIQ